MTDTDTKRAFAERLQQALQAHGMTRADLARHFGENGQQIIGGWIKRGRIGQPSVPTVRALLPRTSMEWLNEGIDREKFLVESPVQVNSASQILSLNPVTLHSALTLLMFDEDTDVGGGPYDPPSLQKRLAELYEWVERDGGTRLTPASNAEFIRQVEARRRARGLSGYEQAPGERHGGNRASQ